MRGRIIALRTAVAGVIVPGMAGAILVLALLPTAWAAAAVARSCSATAETDTDADTDCALGEIVRDVVQRERSVRKKIAELRRLLPATDPGARVNLPSRAELDRLHAYTRGYAEEYCSVYFYLWPGDEKRKALRARSCALSHLAGFDRFLDRLLVCARTGDLGATCLLPDDECTPIDCR